MKNTTFRIFSALLLVSLIFGCATSKDLDPAGIYHSDAYLYNADSAIVAAYSTVDAFLTFEYQNNSYIKTNCPAVFNIANDIRDKMPTVLKDVSKARNLYIKYLGNTNESTANLILATNTLDNAITEINAISLTAATAASQTPIAAAFTNALTMTPSLNITNIILNTTIN